MRRTNNLIGHAYDDLLKLIIEYNENKKLPLSMIIHNTDSVTFNDADELISWIKDDIGLAASINTYFCYECGEIHTELTVDYPDIEDTGLPLQ